MILTSIGSENSGASIFLVFEAVKVKKAMERPNLEILPRNVSTVLDIVF